MIVESVPRPIAKDGPKEQGRDSECEESESDKDTLN